MKIKKINDTEKSIRYIWGDEKFWQVCNKKFKKKKHKHGTETIFGIAWSSTVWIFFPTVEEHQATDSSFCMNYKLGNHT